MARRSSWSSTANTVGGSWRVFSWRKGSSGTWTRPFVGSEEGQAGCYEQGRRVRQPGERVGGMESLHPRCCEGVRGR